MVVSTTYELKNSASRSPAYRFGNSTQPFCLDTLVFNEWLQFVFIEKIRALIKNGQALPVNCAIAPYGEEFFRGQSLDVAGLLGVLTAIDKLFSE